MVDASIANKSPCPQHHESNTAFRLGIPRTVNFLFLAAYIPLIPAAMFPYLTIRAVCACSFLLTLIPQAYSASSPAPAAHPPTGTVSSTAPTSTQILTPSQSGSTSAGASSSTPPDVYLNVPNLSVGRIELDVDNLQADINLNANVASLVTINAGVAVSIQKVNITITDVSVQLELIVRLNHLVDIVNRVFQSLDLNPLLISAANNLTSILQPVIGAVDGLLGSITQGGTKLSFLVDNLGNIVQQVIGANGSPVSTIAGNYLTNMTATGATQQLQNGLTQKTYSYSPLNALVNIVFNTAGQVVQATVAKQSGSGGNSSTATPSSTAAASSSTH